jgi:hypothetical protein
MDRIFPREDFILAILFIDVEFPDLLSGYRACEFMRKKLSGVPNFFGRVRVNSSLKIQLEAKCDRKNGKNPDSFIADWRAGGQGVFRDSSRSTLR